MIASAPLGFSVKIRFVIVVLSGRGVNLIPDVLVQLANGRATNGCQRVEHDAFHLW
jgi:hypothetical protein